MVDECYGEGEGRMTADCVDERSDRWWALYGEGAEPGARVLTCDCLYPGEPGWVEAEIGYVKPDRVKVGVAVAVVLGVVGIVLTVLAWHGRGWFSRSERLPVKVPRR
jgi:hypothetical protein